MQLSSALLKDKTLGDEDSSVRVKRSLSSSLTLLQLAPVWSEGLMREHSRRLQRPMSSKSGPADAVGQAH